MTEDQILTVTYGTRWEKTIANMLESSVDVSAIEQMLTVVPECLPLFAQCFDTHERKACGGMVLAWCEIVKNHHMLQLLDDLECEGMIYAVINHEALNHVYVFSPIVREV